MQFYGELGCDQETDCLHFGDNLHHYPDPGVRFVIRIREELPQFYYAGIRLRSVFSEYF